MPDKIINLVNDIVINAENRGVARLVIENESANGSKIQLHNRELISFGSYSYLALETDKRLKDAAIAGIEKFGLQYPSSRVYTSLPAYAELESLFKEIFGAPVVLTTSLSLGHAGVMPVIIQREDILILDQHVHSSVQDAAQRLKAKSVELNILRHNDMEALEQKIIQFSTKYEKVWYALDGIYSMYGDVAPLKELYALLEKYPSFYLYVDDAHGVSSYGKNGSGWVLDQIEFHERMVLTTGMAKAFGTMGGIFAIKDPELYQHARNCTGSLIFSGGQSVPVLAASVASAKIHLSEEITVRQDALADKIYYCHKLLKDAGLPDVSDPKTPIFFIALGLLRVGYNIVKKMIDDGFYVNLASFPAVSESCTGIRFTITLNHSMEDIEQLVDTLVKNYPIALEEENVTTLDVEKAFRKVPNYRRNIEKSEIPLKVSSLRLFHCHTINELNTTQWDRSFEQQAMLKSEFLTLLESTFEQNPLKEHNWKFHYFVVFDTDDTPLITTFFTEVHTKEDMLSAKKISEQLEEQRKGNKYFFTSTTLLMGTLVTEGSHLYVDKSNPLWREGMSLVLNEIEGIKDSANINTVVLRDFELDKELFEFFRDESFLKFELPDAHRIGDLNWNNELEFVEPFQKHRRHYLRKVVFEFEQFFDVKIQSNPDQSEVLSYWKLYQNVNERSLEINNFDLPFEFFLNLSLNENWEFIELRMKQSHELVAMMLCQKDERTYTPLFVGLNYDFLSHNIYPQILWQTIKRGRELNVEEIPLGFTASQTKRKFGATTEKRFGFVKMKDNYNLMQLELFQ